MPVDFTVLNVMNCGFHYSSGSPSCYPLSCLKVISSPELANYLDIQPETDRGTYKDLWGHYVSPFLKASITCLLSTLFLSFLPISQTTFMCPPHFQLAFLPFTASLYPRKLQHSCAKSRTGLKSAVVATSPTWVPHFPFVILFHFFLLLAAAIASLLLLPFLLSTHQQTNILSAPHYMY